MVELMSSGNNTQRMAMLVSSYESIQPARGTSTGETLSGREKKGGPQAPKHRTQKPGGN
jgi:hypothetical protein